MPIIGYLNSQIPDVMAERLRGFRNGLKETGYVEGESVAIEYRWAENQLDCLPALAADLVRRRVAVIAAPGGIPLALAAKAATTTIPIVSAIADDPVGHGLIASVARPGGNLTGANFLNIELRSKRLGLLRELLPAAARVAVLANPTDPAAEFGVRDVETASRAMGMQIKVLNASTNDGINAAFATFVRERPDALFVIGDAFFTSRRVQLVNLATHHRLPAIFPNRESTEIGGLMSYGSNITDAWHQVGVYSGHPEGCEAGRDWATSNPNLSNSP
jgi:putative ABC transport system substrate-binding protein